MPSDFRPRLNSPPALRYDLGERDRGPRGRAPSDTATERQAGSADMDVNGIGSVSGSFPVRPSQGAARPAPTPDAKPISTDDQVEISSVGRMFDAASRSSDVRSERLAQIKAAIDQGVYDTDDKLEAALERMLSEIRLEDERG